MDSRRRGARDPAEPAERVGLRIIGGSHRGRKLETSGDPRTRPMKDRVREAVFNLLGPAVAGMHAIDLFAGTGALGLEAISRGAAQATFFEQHYPTADLIRRNIGILRVEDQTEVIVANTFIWFRKQAARDELFGRRQPWLIFSSPPYEFYASRRDEMLSLIGRLAGAAPAGSILAVEADARFDFELLPRPPHWDIREYPPARVAIGRFDSVIREGEFLPKYL
ncbi:MAG: RsmD family RNA methyltransferase [Pirellulales bacterium]